MTMPMCSRLISAACQWARAIVAISALLHSACVPTVGALYIPSGKGRLEVSGCAGPAGRSFIFDVTENFKIHVWLDQSMPADSSMLVNVSMFVSPGHSASLESRVVEIRTPVSASPTAEAIALSRIVGAPAREVAMDPGEPMIGDTPAITSSGFYARATVYQYHIGLPIGRPQEFALTLPKIIVDGRDMGPMEITYRLRTHVGLAMYCQ